MVNQDLIDHLVILNKIKVVLKTHTIENLLVINGALVLDIIVEDRQIVENFIRGGVTFVLNNDFESKERGNIKI